MALFSIKKSEGDNLKNEIVLGFKKALPIMFGYTPLGIAFGAIAQTNGISVFEVLLMSLVIFSGSGQFIAVSLLVAGVNIYTVLITVTLINSRYFLFSMSLSQKINNLSHLQKFLAPQGITDETYLAAMIHDDKVSPTVWFSLSGFSHFAWIIATIIGAVLGSKLGPTKALGLDFALPAMFIALAIMVIKKQKDVFVGALAGIIALILMLMGQKEIYILAATFVAASVGMACDLWKK